MVEGTPALHLTCDPVNLPETGASSGPFKISDGVWELAGATRSNLYSPDVSFDASVKVDLYDAGGAKLEEKNLLICTGSNGWSRFKERFDVPANAAAASVEIAFNKTHGDLWIADLSLGYIGKPTPMEGGDRRTIFTTNRTGGMFYPGDDVRMDMTLETPVQLSGTELNFSWELTDFWSERLAAPQKGTLTADGTAANGWN